MRNGIERFAGPIGKFQQYVCPRNDTKKLSTIFSTTMTVECLYLSIGDHTISYLLKSTRNIV